MDHMTDTLKQIDSRFGEESAKNTLIAIKDAHEAPEEFMERAITYANVLKGGKYKINDYIRAVQYTTYRSMDMTMKQSFMQTYPERCYRDGERKPEGTIDALASLYDKTKLVQSIISQAQIPLHLIMMNERVRAANVLVDLMVNSGSEKIQMESADKLLNHIALPETQKIELDVGYKADETIVQLNETLSKISSLAQDRIKAGMVTPVEVIES